MSGFLVDTNCISEAVRRIPNQRVAAWIESVEESQLYLSVFTLGEIRKGIVALPPSRRRSDLERWVEFDLRRRFAGRILGVDEEIADQWGRLTGRLRAEGRAMPVLDAILAATALRHDLTVATRNVRDFKVAGVNVFDPWNEAG